MKRFNVMIAILIIISCNNKNLAIEDVNFIDESKLLISLDYVNAKSVGENHNNQADDNNINVLDIFIFNADGPKKGTLDGYKQFSSGEYKNLEVTATTGLKNIYVVANSKNDNWKGVNTLDVFLNEVTFLKDEALKDFTMLGKLTATLQPVTSVTMAVERVISKIELLSIKTAFKDTPYEGESLKNVKVYLTNVQGAKSYDSDYKINPVI